MFGRYGSQRMKDWLEIARLYERDSIYLGEASQILVRNINYELPNVKKQITKFDQLIDEAQKKIQDQTASEAVLNAQRTAFCQKLGIKGENLRDEFLEKLKDLPKLYENIETTAKKLNQAVEIYGKALKNTECLPVLRHIIQNGNTTVYEYIHHEAPLSIEEPPVQIKLTIDSSVNRTGGNSETVKKPIRFEIHARFLFLKFSAIFCDAEFFLNLNLNSCRLILVKVKSILEMILILVTLEAVKK